MAGFTELLDWVTANADTILDDDQNNVMGVGVGTKDGGPITQSDTYCITAFVDQKQTESQLFENNVTTFETAFANSTGATAAELAVDLDVVEVGSSFVAQPGRRVGRALRGLYGGAAPRLDLQKKFDALRMGIGITNPEHSYPTDLAVGTLGFFVTDQQGRLYLVSNNHVIAEENAAQQGDLIVQPGTLDLTDTELGLLDTSAKLGNNLGIARLQAWKDIEFHNPVNRPPPNQVDCALAELDDAARGLDDIARVGKGGRVLGTGALPAGDPVTGAVVGSSRVYKAGRTTGWTEGDITALGVQSNVRYTRGSARFVGQVAISPTVDNDGPFSDEGDSGSAILNCDHEIVALLFAGGPQRTLANPIDTVLSALEDNLGRGVLSVVSQPPGIVQP